MRATAPTSDWVTLESLPHEAIAQLWQDRLARADIPCQVRGRAAASTAGALYPLNTSWSNPMGGIEVLVRREDVAAARRVLELGSPRRRGRSTHRWVEAFWVRALIMFWLACNIGVLVFVVAAIGTQNPYVSVSAGVLATLILFAVMLYVGRSPRDTA